MRILALFAASLALIPYSARAVAADGEAKPALFPEKLSALDSAITQAIEQKRCPGAVLRIEHGGAVYEKPYGERALLPEPEPMTVDTIFDGASLTKVLATTPCVMKLLELGKLDLDAPANRYFPEFQGAGKEAITVRQLLTHTSGLRPDVPLTEPWSGRDHGIALACAEPLPKPPGTSFRYSDINFIVLGEIVKRVSGQALEDFAAAEIYRPLKMTDTGFVPPPELKPRIAPTEKNADGEFLRGVVHDPTARRMGGVAGHAGLFTTAADVARFARMMLGDGEAEGVRIFQPATVHLMTSVQSPPGVSERRGLGWDIDSPYARPRGEHFPIGSYGHTGWTGGALWIDPFSKTIMIFLSNRNHPDGKGNVVALWHTLGTLTAEALGDFDFSHGVPGGLGRVIE